MDAGGFEEFVDCVTAESWTLDAGVLDEVAELETDKDNACRMFRQRERAEGQRWATSRGLPFGCRFLRNRGGLPSACCVL